MKTEYLWNGIRLLQPEDAFRIGTDSVLISDFMTLPKGAKVCDLGSGSGTISLLLCGRSADCHVTGVELQEQAHALFCQNIRENKLEARVTPVLGDLREIRTLLRAGSFDCVVSNPPYFPPSGGEISPNNALAIARTELCCTPEDICAAAQWLLKYGGTLAVVHKPERLCDLICTMRTHKIEPKRIRFVRHSINSPVCLVMLEGKLGAKSGLRYAPDLLQYTPSGEETEEYRTIYHH